MIPPRPGTAMIQAKKLYCVLVVVIPVVVVGLIFSCYFAMIDSGHFVNVNGKQTPVPAFRSMNKPKLTGNLAPITTTIATLTPTPITTTPAPMTSTMAPITTTLITTAKAPSTSALLNHNGQRGRQILFKFPTMATSDPNLEIFSRLLHEALQNRTKNGGSQKSAKKSFTKRSPIVWKSMILDGNNFTEFPKFDLSDNSTENEKLENNSSSTTILAVVFDIQNRPNEFGKYLISQNMLIRKTLCQFICHSYTYCGLHHHLPLGVYLNDEVALVLFASTVENYCPLNRTVVRNLNSALFRSFVFPFASYRIRFIYSHSTIFYDESKLLSLLNPDSEQEEEEEGQEGEENKVGKNPDEELDEEVAELEPESLDQKDYDQHRFVELVDGEDEVDESDEVDDDEVDDENDDGEDEDDDYETDTQFEARISRTDINSDQAFPFGTIRRRNMLEALQNARPQRKIHRKYGWRLVDWTYLIYGVFFTAAIFILVSNGLIAMATYAPKCWLSRGVMALNRLLLCGTRQRTTRPYNLPGPTNQLECRRPLRPIPISPPPSATPPPPASFLADDTTSNHSSNSAPPPSYLESCQLRDYLFEPLDSVNIAAPTSNQEEQPMMTYQSPDVGIGSESPIENIDLSSTIPTSTIWSSRINNNQPMANTGQLQVPVYRMGPRDLSLENHPYADRRFRFLNGPTFIGRVGRHLIRYK